MKKARLTLLALLLFIANIIIADIPVNYYKAANGKKRVELQIALYNIIKGHKSYSYGDLWTALKKTDEDPNNSKNFILIYTGRSISKSSKYPAWNREHVWAKSRGGFGKSRPGGTDMHHLRPCDVDVNSSRGSKDFDNGGTAVSKAPECKSTSSTWEPRDAVKGDVARMMFYMATRYKSGSEYNLKLTNQIGGGKGSGTFGKLSTLIKWNIQDPVDAFERRRNEVIYGYQKNRNPFIDHPEWVNKIWGNDNTPVQNPNPNPDPDPKPNPSKEITLINEAFTTKIPSTWETVSITSSNNWKFYKGSATMNGFQEDTKSNDWLITPKIEYSQNDTLTLSFDSQWNYGKTDSELTLKYSINYTGNGKPEEAKWIDLIFKKSDESKTKVSSGKIVLKKLETDKIYYAFNYKSSDSPRRWKINNFLLKVNKGKDTSTSIDKNFKDKKYLIYPNPTKKNIKITPTDKVQNVKIYDLNGNILKFSKTVSQPIDISDFQNGMYILKIEELNGQYYYKKIIKQ